MADRRDGFTLIELLVALAVFSLAALALLNLAAENTRTAARVETRALAAIVAGNRAVEALIRPAPPSIGVETGGEDMAGRRWAWTRTVSPTARPDMLRIDVAVLEAGQAVGQVTVFRATPS
jgi:general secretion pathway protein I